MVYLTNAYCLQNTPEVPKEVPFTIFLTNLNMFGILSVTFHSAVTAERFLFKWNPIAIKLGVTLLLSVLGMMDYLSNRLVSNFSVSIL